MNMSSDIPNRPKKWMRYLIIALWAAIIIGIIAVLAFFFKIANGDLPSFEELENPKYDLASVVYDANGEPFGKYYIENREQIDYEELSPHIIDALIATEDIRYEKHSGIDFKALTRVAFKTLLFQKQSSGGGSTISQQLAKLLFKRSSLANKNKLQRAIALLTIKIKEWFTAVKLERQYTKQEIIAMYLNKFEFINGAHGVQAAAQTYFAKDQSMLDINEAATLVGMLKNPSLYNPIRFPDKSKGRRDVVLAQLVKAEMLEASAYDTLHVKELDMSGFLRAAHDIGPAPYFRAELTKWLKKLLKQEEYLKPDGTHYNIYTDGLSIHTTIDLNYQKHAESAVHEHMATNQTNYWKVWKNRNPWTYEADHEMRKIRLGVLQRRIKESERYLNLHNRYLGKLKEQLRSKYNANLPLSEKVISALIDVKERKSKMSTKLKNGDINETYIKAYKSIVTSNEIDDLATQFGALEEAFKTEFNTKIKMRVFDYENGDKEVEMSPKDSVKFHNKHLQSGMLAVDPKTGYIKAWVGGVGFKYFKYDHVNSRRQVGSTIKPFVYATAISLQGISPCQEYEDIQYTIAPGDVDLFVNEEWSPANANDEFTGNPYNLYQGLLYSKNSISVRLVRELGSVNVIREVLHNCGIDRDLTLDNGRLAVPKLPSIVLGAADLTVKEMTGAYTTFANNGSHTEPIFVSKIVDKNGKIIYTGIPDRRIALNPLYNAVMVDMLKNNMGGGYNIGIKTVTGGKTGTTNDFSDGWFMGVTPNLVVGTWVGGDDNWIRFLTLQDGQGFVMARPIFQKFMQAVEKDTAINFNTEVQFHEPPDGFDELVDCTKFKQVKPADELNQSLNQQSAFDEFEDEEEFDEEEEFDDEEEFDEEQQ